MGARVIFQALQHMTKPGIVEHAVLIGAPVTNDTRSWEKARSVVAGRLVNAYSSEDWALRFLYRHAFWTLVGLCWTDTREC